MSTLRLLNAQIGISVTPSQNFTWYQPTVPDGSVRLGVGNSGATTKDMIKVSSSDIILDNPKALVSPSLYDSSKSLATTEHVYNRMATFPGAGYLTDIPNLTIDLEPVPELIYVGTVTGTTLRLPDPTVFRIGAVLEIVNIGTNNVTIVRKNSNNFIALGNDGSTYTQFILKPGTNIRLTSLGNNYWYNLGGSAQLEFSSGIFDKSLSTNGWQKLPSGLIIQWGVGTTSSSTNVLVTYPIVFPTARLSNYVTADSATNQFVTCDQLGVSGLYVNGWLSNTGARTAVQFKWLAIGY